MDEFLTLEEILGRLRCADGDEETADFDCMAYELLGYFVEWESMTKH